ncbi:Shedu immune nuclease family protein [Solidesulfovibrio sp. C21]|uniref:Shedu immune nuclease family protein n=1 Tax=Solidesulfovibrio sp. C21 TaxID=3398613 RepID=UPI0039FBAF56
MKNLSPLHFDASKCRDEWNDFSYLLGSKASLEEAKDILPFFKVHIQLSSLISRYIAVFRQCDVYAHEYEIYGDFTADLVIGDTSTKHYLLVEFENAAPDGIFKRKPGKSTPVWAPRFEGAFSQIIDWMWKLDDMRSTGDYLYAFGDREVKFHGLIVVGMGMSLDASDANRLEWRNNKVIVNNNSILCVSYERLRDDCDWWLKTYYGV